MLIPSDHHRGHGTLSELVQLPMLGPDPADRAAGRAHDHGFGFDHFSAELHAAQHMAVGDAGRREQAFAFDHIFDLIFTAWIFDTHFGGAFALPFGIENEPRLHLTRMQRSPAAANTPSGAPPMPR